MNDLNVTILVIQVMVFAAQFYVLVRIGKVIEKEHERECLRFENDMRPRIQAWYEREMKSLQQD